MKASEAVDALGALAQESRLAVYRALVKRGPEGYTPGELAEKLQLPSPTLSFHLKELQRTGLVSSQREGRFLYYGANFTQMNQLIEFLTAHCCSLSAGSCDTSVCVPAKSIAVKSVRARKRA